MTPSLFSSGQQGKEVQDLLLSEITDDYLENFARGETHTARAKRYDLASFLTFLGKLLGGKKVNELTVGDWNYSACQNFVDDKLRSGEAPATVARRLATLKHMGRILAEKIPGFINPARDIKAPKADAIRPKSLSPSEIELVRERAKALSFEKNSFSRIRNETLIALLLATGLRAEEVRTLKITQLSDSLEWIEQVKTKGRRFRNVYIDTNIRPKLSEYLKNRTQELQRFGATITRQNAGLLPVFVSLHGAKADDPNSFFMSAKSIWRVVRQCSVDTRLHPHLLRHTFATELLNSSKDVRLVSQALGHSDVRITMRYTERFDEEVARAIEDKLSKKEVKPTTPAGNAK